MADLSGKTFDQLRAEFISLGDQLSVTAESRRELSEEIERRMKKAEASARIVSMSDDEKTALRAVLESKR